MAKKKHQVIALMQLFFDQISWRYHMQVEVTYLCSVLLNVPLSSLMYSLAKV